MIQTKTSHTYITIFSVVVDHNRNLKASTGRFELIYKERPNIKTNFSDKQLTVIGVNYFDKYKQEGPTGSTEPSIHSSVIKNILNINPEQVRHDVRRTLERILSIIHVEREKRIADKGLQQFQSETFKNMLAEFVSIISSTTIDLTRLQQTATTDSNATRPA